MTKKLKLGKWLAALGICAALTLPVFAQHPRGNNFQNPNRPPKAGAAARQQHQQEKQQRQQEKQAQREAQKNANRPPQANPDAHANNPNRTPSGDAHPNNPNRPPNAYTPPPRKFDNLNPEQKQRVLENYKNYEKRTPAEKQQIQEAKKNWDGLTDTQKTHIKNDVMPKWKQLPPDRQRAIRSRLNVLKNMPESARNQHLSDPNFTRGMNEEDKAMLHDLSHLHVGGAPEPPHE
jgi:hypothetical protein